MKASAGTDQLRAYDGTKAYINEDLMGKVEYLKEGGYRHILRTFRSISFYDGGTRTAKTELLDIANSSFNNTYRLNLSCADIIKGDFVSKTSSSKSFE